MSAAAWKVRRAGSPRASEPMAAEDVLEGVRDGDWEPTDEVIGPADADWRPLEGHPVFAEAVADLDAPPRREPPDESRLDMNPLIDVALVLLIFFILTTSYDAVRKSLDIPAAVQEDKKKGAKPKAIEKKDLDKLVAVVARNEGGKPVVKVDGKPVEMDKLTEAVRAGVGTGRREMFMDAQGVPWGVHVAIIDAAKGAGVQKIHVRARNLEKPADPPKE